MDSDPTHPEPSAVEVASINAVLSARRIAVRAPEAADDGGWQVRIETADGLTEFVRGPRPGLVWVSALAWIGA